MSKKFICFALSAMLILTLIPQITFAVEDFVEMAEGDGMTTEPLIEEPAEAEEPYDTADEGAAEDADADTDAADTEAADEADAEPAVVADDTDAEDPEADDSEPFADSGVITGFVPLETSDYYYEGTPEEEELTLNLPDCLHVYLDGSDQPSDIAVEWEAVEDFDETDFYFYSMKPVWDEDIILSDTLCELTDVPWITVYRQEPKNEQIEPILTEEELDPVYTEEEGPVDPEAEGSDEASLRAFACDTAGEILDAVTEDSYANTASNTAAIYNYLTQKMGLNTAAACGVMVNINAESAMSPINLQNTYNSSFGLSDSAYTKAVDRGKGSYRTSGGRSKNFKTDRGGYGLCQWTSSGRKTNLLKKALSSSRSIGNINMQLEFLNEELKGYQQVLTTLRKVPNNAAGAYIAATEFCLAFEIPANTISTAASRGKNCLSNYWKTYSGHSASASGTSFLSLCGYSYPTAVKKGKGMDVTGYAVSNYSIKSLTGKIKDSKGKVIYSKTLHPHTTAYRISNLDSAMKFGKLGTGDYTYQLTATDSKGKSVSASHTFTVSASSSTNKTLGFATTGSPVSTSTVAKPQTQTTTKAVKKPAAKVKKAYAGKYPKLPKRGYFKKGDKGNQVKYLQKYLKWYGYKIKIDGRYGPGTVKIVKKLQKALGEKQDGRFGKKTLAKAKKIKK